MSSLSELRKLVVALQISVATGDDTDAISRQSAEIRRLRQSILRSNGVLDQDEYNGSLDASMLANVRSVLERAHLPSAAAVAVMGRGTGGSALSAYAPSPSRDPIFLRTRQHNTPLLSPRKPSQDPIRALSPGIETRVAEETTLESLIADTMMTTTTTTTKTPVDTRPYQHDHHSARFSLPFSGNESPLHSARPLMSTSQSNAMATSLSSAALPPSWASILSFASPSSARVLEAALLMRNASHRSSTGNTAAHGEMTSTRKEAPSSSSSSSSSFSSLPSTPLAAHRQKRNSLNTTNYGTPQGPPKASTLLPPLSPLERDALILRLLAERSEKVAEDKRVVGRESQLSEHQAVEEEEGEESHAQSMSIWDSKNHLPSRDEGNAVVKSHGLAREEPATPSYYATRVMSELEVLAGSGSPPFPENEHPHHKSPAAENERSHQKSPAAAALERFDPTGDIFFDQRNAEQKENDATALYFHHVHGHSLNASSSHPSSSLLSSSTESTLLTPSPSGSFSKSSASETIPTSLNGFVSAPPLHHLAPLSPELLVFPDASSPSHTSDDEDSEETGTYVPADKKSSKSALAADFAQVDTGSFSHRQLENASTSAAKGIDDGDGDDDNDDDDDDDDSGMNMTVHMQHPPLSLSSDASIRLSRLPLPITSLLAEKRKRELHAVASSNLPPPTTLGSLAKSLSAHSHAARNIDGTASPIMAVNNQEHGAGSRVRVLASFELPSPTELYPPPPRPHAKSSLLPRRQVGNNDASNKSAASSLHPTEGLVVTTAPPSRNRSRKTTMESSQRPRTSSLLSRSPSTSASKPATVVTSTSRESSRSAASASSSSISSLRSSSKNSGPRTMHSSHPSSSHPPMIPSSQRVKPPIPSQSAINKNVCVSHRSVPTNLIGAAVASSSVEPRVDLSGSTVFSYNADLSGTAKAETRVDIAHATTSFSFSDTAVYDDTTVLQLHPPSSQASALLAPTSEASSVPASSSAQNSSSPFMMRLATSAALSTSSLVPPIETSSRGPLQQTSSLLPSVETSSMSVVTSASAPQQEASAAISQEAQQAISLEAQRRAALRVAQRKAALQAKAAETEALEQERISQKWKDRDKRISQFLKRQNVRDVLQAATTNANRNSGADDEEYPSSATSVDEILCSDVDSARQKSAAALPQRDAAAAVTEYSRWNESSDIRSSRASESYTASSSSSSLSRPFHSIDALASVAPLSVVTAAGKRGGQNFKHSTEATETASMESILERLRLSLAPPNLGGRQHSSTSSSFKRTFISGRQGKAPSKPTISAAIQGQPSSTSSSSSSTEAADSSSLNCSMFDPDRFLDEISFFVSSSAPASASAGAMAAPRACAPTAIPRNPPASPDLLSFSHPGREFPPSTQVSVSAPLLSAMNSLQSLNHQALTACDNLASASSSSSSSSARLAVPDDPYPLQEASIFDDLQKENQGSSTILLSNLSSVSTGALSPLLSMSSFLAYEDALAVREHAAHGLESSSETCGLASSRQGEQQVGKGSSDTAAAVSSISAGDISYLLADLTLLPGQEA